MEAAMTAVKGGCTIKRAAEEHGVPVSTLRDRISGRVLRGTKPGPKPYLSSAEEGELSSFLQLCSNTGYGRTRSDVLCIARSVAAEKGVLKGSKVMQGWWRRFCERQPELSLRRGDVTAHIRMDSVNHETMTQYFTLLKDVLTEHDLFTKPAQIHNVDESGIPFGPRAPNVVAAKGVKKVRYRSSGKKGQVTIVGCASAAGQAMPPMVIFDAKRLNPEWTKGELAMGSVTMVGSTQSCLKRGWQNTFFSMRFQLVLCYYFSTATVRNTSHSFYGLPSRMMSSFCAFRHTPLMKRSHWIVVFLAPSKLTGRMCVISTYSIIQGVSLLDSNLVHCFRKRGVLLCHLPT